MSRKVSPKSAQIILVSASPVVIFTLVLAETLKNIVSISTKSRMLVKGTS